jgi:hypothetical protein
MSSVSNPNPKTTTLAAESLLIWLSVAVMTAAVLLSQPLQSANDRSRWCTVWSLVERQTYQIDEIDSIPRWSTIDKVRFQRDATEEPHFYSSKPPLLATIVAGVYAVERAVLGYGLYSHTQFVTRLLLLVVNILPLTIALFVLRNTLHKLTASATTRLFVLAVAGFGSMLNPYLTTLNNHTPAAVCAVFCLAAATSLCLGGSRLRKRDYLALGFFAALTSCFELPAALLGLAAFALALRLDLRATWVWFVPAALLPLSAFFLTNWLVTGGVRPFYAYYGTEVYEFIHEGIPSYWMNPQDLDSNTEGTATYLLHCVFGHHGLISLTPVLLITVAGWFIVILPRRRQSAGSGSAQPYPDPCDVQRLLGRVGCVLTLITLGFYLTRTQNYNYGGNSVALRWMLWLSPFWWIGMVPALERWMIGPWRRGTAYLLLFLSVISVSVSLNQPWRPSWLFRGMESLEWIDYRTKPEPFAPPRTSVIHEIPDTPNASGTWSTVDGDTLTLKTVDMSDTTSSSADSTWLLLTRSDSQGRQEPDLLLEVNMSEFATGMDIAEWLGEVRAVSGNGDMQPATESQRRQLRLLLRGVPVARPYVAQGRVWKKWPWRPELAYEIERGATQVRVRSRTRGELTYRCEIAWSDEAPFGVLEWKTMVIDESGTLVSASMWTMQDNPQQ